MKEDHGLCPGPTMLDQEGQSAYARLAMPFGGSILQLCKMMEQYVSFSNDVVLGSVALLEGSLEAKCPFQ